jgi:hypothetical protein
LGIRPSLGVVLRYSQPKTSKPSKADIEGAEGDAIERGGSIEVFPDAELAKGRAVYTRAS